MNYLAPIVPPSLSIITTGLNSPEVVAVEADGKIIVVDNNVLKRMNADGTGIITLTTGFSSAKGVVVQADGKILVADTGK